MGSSDLAGDLAGTRVHFVTECLRPPSASIFPEHHKVKMAPPAAELKAMTDAFEGIDRLAEGAPRTDGAPNFRRLPGFPLLGTGQTSIEGYQYSEGDIENRTPWNVPSHLKILIPVG